MVAAVNRPGNGRQFNPIGPEDDPATDDLREDLYTVGFGGTSGAAPIVAGVAGLILSKNDTLSAADVKRVLMETADKNLDFNLDLQNDPNLQGLKGEFMNGKSLYFGAGKVNALEAVMKA